MFLEPMSSNVTNFKFDIQYQEFYNSLQNGTLKEYTYLVPRFSDVIKGLSPNSQHPSEDIRNGE